MKKKAFFIIFKGLSMKQKHDFFRAGGEEEGALESDFNRRIY